MRSSSMTHDNFNLITMMALGALSMPGAVLADDNTGPANGSISVTIDNSAICNITRCITSENDVILPVEVSTEKGVIYVY